MSTLTVPLNGLLMSDSLIAIAGRLLGLSSGTVPPRRTPRRPRLPHRTRSVEDRAPSRHALPRCERVAVATNPARPCMRRAQEWLRPPRTLPVVSGERAMPRMTTAPQASNDNPLRFQARSVRSAARPGSRESGSKRFICSCRRRRPAAVPRPRRSTPRLRRDAGAPTPGAFDRRASPPRSAASSGS